MNYRMTQMKQKIIRVQILLIYVSIFIVGCMSPPPAMQTQTPTGSATISFHTATPIHLDTEVVYAPGPTLTNTSTLINKPTATATRMSPTWTPLPTLPLFDARNLVADLLENNAGCLLPCWWGIVPGETTWQEAYSMLSPIAISFGDYDLPDRPDAPDRHRRDVHVPTPQDVSYANHLFHDYITVDGIVAQIEVYNYDLAPAYYLPTVLGTYGMPDEIWLRTFSSEDMGSRPFLLDLFYFSRGLLFEFSGGAGEDMGESLRVFPQTMDSPFIYLWDPQVNLTFDAAIDEFLDVMNFPYPLPLLEAAGMEVETFYNYFVDPNSIHYMETPDDIWPEP